jgi:hypothetical protein
MYETRSRHDVIDRKDAKKSSAAKKRSCETMSNGDSAEDSILPAESRVHTRDANTV